MQRSVRIVVKGRVQGVGYRMSTQRVAIRLNVTGFVRNLPQGDVEIVAKGASEAVQGFVGWCRKGPNPAKVDEVIIDEINLDEDLSGFFIR